MKVRVYAINVTGIGMYRGILPAAHSGADAAVIDRGIPAVQDTEGKVVAVDPIDADVVVLFRAATRPLVEAIPYIQRQGVAVVVDVDDDIGAVNSRHPAHMIAHMRAQHRNMQQACRLADLVTVSSPALQQRYRRDAVILRNCVEKRLLEIPRRDDGRTIGWGGIGAEHLGDFDNVGTGICEPLNASSPLAGSRFLVVGTAPADSYRRPDETTGFVPFREYHQQLARITVGLAPLGDNAFNRAKSYLKPLEYAALGIPFIRSRSPEYDRLGWGYVAERQRHWRKWAHLLLSDRDLRETESYLLRERAAHHTIEGCGWRWAEAWQMAVKKRTAAGRVVVS